MSTVTKVRLADGSEMQIADWVSVPLWSSILVWGLARYDGFGSFEIQPPYAFTRGTYRWWGRETPVAPPFYNVFEYVEQEGHGSSGWALYCHLREIEGIPCGKRNKTQRRRLQRKFGVEVIF